MLVFSQGVCYFCDITVLNFSKKTSFSNIYRNVAILRQNLRTLLPKPTMLCLRFVFLYILFRILSIFIFYCFVFFTIILLICIFVNLLHVFRNIVNLFYILFSCSVSLNVNVDKDTTSLELWIIFPVTFVLTDLV